MDTLIRPLIFVSVTSLCVYLSFSIFIQQTSIICNPQIQNIICYFLCSTWTKSILITVLPIQMNLHNHSDVMYIVSRNAHDVMYLCMIMSVHIRYIARVAIPIRVYIVCPILQCNNVVEYSFPTLYLIGFSSPPACMRGRGQDTNRSFLCPVNGYSEDQPTRHNWVLTFEARGFAFPSQ